MKRWIGLLCLSVLLLGCKATLPAPAAEAEGTTGPIIPVFTVNPDRTYLWENPLVIDEVRKELLLPGLRVSVSYPEISGLADQAVADRINERVAGVAAAYLNEMKEHWKQQQGLHGFMYGSIPFNHNGMLAVTLSYSNFYDAYGKSQETVLFFDLGTGEPIKLADLFLPGAAYGQAIDQWLARQALAENMEGSILLRPLPPVDEELSFYLTGEALVLRYPEGNPYFMNGSSMSFQIPFHQLAEPMVAFDRFEADASLFQDPIVKRYLLPSSFTSEPRVEKWYGDGYYLEFYTLRISDLSNAVVEEKINELVAQEEALFRQKVEVLIEEAQVRFQKKPENLFSKLLSCEVSSVGKTISLRISEYENTYEHSPTRHQVRVYHLETGQQLRLQDLFIDGYDFFPVLDQFVRDRLAKQYYKWQLVEGFEVNAEQLHFSLHREGLVLYFEPGQVFQEVDWEMNVTIPFEAFGGKTIFD